MAWLKCFIPNPSLSEHEMFHLEFQGLSQTEMFYLKFQGLSRSSPWFDQVCEAIPPFFATKHILQAAADCAKSKLG